MFYRTRFGIALLSAILLPAASAFAHGGGGGGGGHGGGGGGGHGGGGGGHSFGGGGGHSFSGGGGGMRSSGSFSGGSGMRSGSSAIHSSNLGATGNHTSFMKNNFSNNTTGHNAIQHNVNRINTNSLNHSNSFVHQNNINNTSLNHWTHNNGNLNHNNLNNLNHNANWNHNNWNNNNWNHNNWNNWGRGGYFFYPWFGFGGFGLFGLYGLNYGYGYPYYYGYGGYGGYGYGNNYGYANNYLAAPTVAADQVPANGDFVDQGEIDFKAGKYQAAARDWQHAMVDDPKNGAILMLLAQALFAMGQYDEAAGATQAGMQMLPEDKWGVVISNYAQLYGNIQDYTDQLKGLEKARDAKPDSPALRFLLGFHFGYLGYPKQAVRELDKGLTLAPKDLGARKVRDIFAAKWPEAPPLPAAAVEAAAEAAKEAGPPQPGANNAPVKPADAPPTPDSQVGTPS